MNVNKDIQGKETLNIISKANSFNKWMFDSIKPYVEGNILEIGSGTGNISNYFISEANNIFLSDINKDYIEYLQNKYSDNKYVKCIFHLDISDKKSIDKLKKYYGYFDTIISLNVLEHINNDEIALKNAYSLLKKGGKIITLVPSYSGLYCKMDRNLKHYRRYNRKAIRKLMQKSDFSEIKLFNFNFIGIFGWYFSGKILGKETIPEKQMGFYNALVPLFKIMDYIVFKKLGLSLISINKK